jgi:hypothetical protein
VPSVNCFGFVIPLCSRVLGRGASGNEGTGTGAAKGVADAGDPPGVEDPDPLLAASGGFASVSVPPLGGDGGDVADPGGAEADPVSSCGTQGEAVDDPGGGAADPDASRGSRGAAAGAGVESTWDRVPAPKTGSAAVSSLDRTPGAGARYTPPSQGLRMNSSPVCVDFFLWPAKQSEN